MQLSSQRVISALAGRTSSLECVQARGVIKVVWAWAGECTRARTFQMRVSGKQTAARTSYDLHLEKPQWPARPRLGAHCLFQPQ